LIILQSIDDHDQLAEIDEGTGFVTFFARHGRASVPATGSRGLFSFIDGLLVCAFRHNKELQLRIDDKVFPLDDTMQAQIMRDGRNTFVLRRRSDRSVVTEITYEARNPDPPLDMDPTPFVDEEDFDLFLLVCNLVNDPGRSRRAFGI
jgi:hypothetical protein